jgi:TonB family protein
MLLTLALRATVVLFVAFAVTMTLRRASAAMRHVIWTCTFACLLALPLLEWSAPKWRVAVPAPIAPAIAVVANTDIPTSAPDITPPRRRFNFAAVWIVGMALALARLLVAFVRLRRIAVKARPAGWLEQQAGRPVSFSDDVDIPITFGILSPHIVFPASAANWPPERLRLVLAHELAHVRRFDCPTQLLAEALCAVYWFHPLVWLAAAQFRNERERACDDAVLNLGTKSSDYAEHLLGVVRSVQTKGAPIAMAISIHSHDLQDRLKAVLKPHVNRRAATPQLAVAIAFIALCITVPIATMRAQSAAGTGNLAGSVYDISRAVVPRATITATGLDTHNKEVAYSGAPGTFAFHSLPAGRYLIEVRAPGFKLFQQTQVVADGANVAFNPTLELGQVNETVDVVGQKPASTTATAPHGIPQRIRVGGNVQAVKLVSQVPPVYPANAQQNGIQGAVVLQGVIAKEGNLLSVEVLSKSVDPELAQAARDAVSQWRYEPTLLNGQPIEVVTTITVNFRLE